MKMSLLAIAGLLTLLVAALHVGCIIFGADWYRFLGAGEQMAQLAENGDVYPTVITSIIVGVFLIWSAYAFSGAGVIGRLPFTKTVLSLICFVLLTRALGFYFLMPIFPENSLTFWWVSSGACMVLGLTYLVGLWRSWEYLGQ